MKVGFKTGPLTWAEGQKLVTDHGARYCELWYREDKADEYQEYFDFFHQHNVQFGFHYWGVVQDNILPSFCFDEMGQYDAGLASVKRAIDQAAQAGAVYVNIHPGSRVLTRVRPSFRGLTIVSPAITLEAKAQDLLIQAATILDNYAKERGVLFLMETVPLFDLDDWAEHDASATVLKTYYPTNQRIIELAQAGIMVTNDFGHTAANYNLDDKDLLWQRLQQDTVTLAPQTNLIHANTISRFDGIDTHDGILAEDWQRGVFPSQAQFLDLLKNFIDRDDVWVIPEPPAKAMSLNYLALEEYVRGLTD